MKIKTKILGMSYTGNHYSVVLEDLTDKKVKLPIIITDSAATEISLISSGVDTLYENLLTSTEVNVSEIYINEFNSGLFEVKVTMDNGNSFKSSASESLILAYVSKCEIFVHEDIMKVSGIKLNEDSTVDYSEIEYDGGDGDEELTDIEELKERLNLAIQDENYELASKIRDEINKYE